MIDLNNIIQDGGYEVAWDYCLEQNIVMPGEPSDHPSVLAYDKYLDEVSFVGHGQYKTFYPNMISESRSGRGSLSLSYLRIPYLGSQNINRRNKYSTR